MLLKKNTKINYTKLFLFLGFFRSTCSTICESDEISCISCYEYRKCNGGTPIGEIFSCENGNDCPDPELKKCKLKLNCYALGKDECKGAGIFPNSLDETSFYVCVGDPFLGFLKFDFSCPEGQYFDVTTTMCVPQETVSENTPTESTPIPTIITTNTTPVPTTITTTTSAPLCKRPGIFSFPSNCKMYIRCSTTLIPFYYVCPGNSYFNENVLKCSMTVTPACQEQILKNITSSSTKGSTILVTSTSTTPTSSKPTISSTPFKCPSAGTFENPINCKTYYRCSSTGKVFEYTCPGSSYYNEFTKRCSLKMTPRCENLLSTFNP